jgi:hypothetical protein
MSIFKEIHSFEASISTRLCSLLLCISFCCGTPLALGQSVEISEWMAANNSILIDDDDDRSDWIEIHNNSFTAINLEGWSLTDDPEHLDIWEFPSITLFPNGYMVVFASGKDRKAPGAPLHTHFSLAREGDYLALLDPSGNIATEFAPMYPEQFTDVSFGSGVSRAEEVVLLSEPAPARALIPTDGSLGTTWTQVDFDDSSWLAGRTGVGYDYGGLINLDVSQMRGANTTAYARIPFDLEEIPALDALLLRIRYEDGYVAYLNGIEIAADNEPPGLDWSSGSTSDRPDSEATQAVDVDISSAIDLLVAGKNVLAIHGLNRASTSSDILILPEIIGQKKTQDGSSTGFMMAPSPGMANFDSVRGVVPPVEFSVPSQVFEGNLNLILALPEGSDEALEIRYTRDGSRPSPSSTLYDAPISISETVQVRAIAVLPGMGQSMIRSKSYIEVSRQTRDFSSNLPIVVLENYRSGRPPQNAKQASFMMLFEPGESRSGFGKAPTLATRSGIKVRGSSTAGRPKPSLSLEAWNEYDQNKNIAPLGMPSESDWVLWGPYNFDLSLMHNPFIYELSNQIGRYAVRTRFVEVFLNVDGGALTDNDYYGVYALMEKISRDEDRVDVERIFPEHDRDPGLSGGYIFKIDRPDPGDSGFSGAGQNVRYVYPKEVDIERPERDAQETYVRRYFSDMGTALGRTSLADGEDGYAGLIDVGAAIDHHLLNVLAFNVDALRLSGYFHKPRNGKLVFGPIWDFDRALGSTDGRDANPRVWRSASGDRGTDFFNYPWWRDMFRDLDFWQRYIDRYQELRRAEFGVDHIHGIVDSMADELREAQPRNVERWGTSPRGGSYQNEINRMKNWLEDRIEFMDGQFVQPPEMTITGTGANRQVNISSGDGGVIYYTLDGSDPRAMGGDPSGQARVYSEPIVLTDSAAIIVRVFDSGHRSLTGANNPPLTSKWSGMAQQLVSVAVPPVKGDLMVTEVHFNPASPNAEELLVNPSFRNEDFEFVEIRNLASHAVELAGLRFVDGIRYDFPSNASLVMEPGSYLVLVKNAQAFAARYAEVQSPLVGGYDGNLSNGGEVLALQSAGGEVLHELAFDDDWYAGADGEGYSLVLKDEGVLPPIGSSMEVWRESSVLNGSPGAIDPGLVQLRIAAIQSLNGSVVIEWLGAAGVTYVVEYTASLENPNWQMLRLVPPLDAEGNLSVTDSAPDGDARFYRLRVQSF